jgi:surface antigen
VIDLTGYTTSQPALPGTAQSLRVAGLQQALERNQSGQVDSWSDKASGDTGDIEPLRTVHSDQYSLCRRFAERIQVGGRVYHLEGTGCHASSGVWDILALSPSTNRSSWTRP